MAKMISVTIVMRSKSGIMSILPLDLDAVDKLADLFRVVVKKADRLIVVAGVVLHLVEQPDARIGPRR